MSYIIKCTDPFVSIKLTETGRMKLAQGQLNFSYWTAGDSEINYDREAIVEANSVDIVLSATSEILRPKDRQPELKSYLSSGGTDYFNVLTPANIHTVKVVVNNEADERGFFSGSSTAPITITTSDFIVSQGLISTSGMTGGTILTIGSSAVSAMTVGDWLLLKLTTPKLGSVTPNANIQATPHLWYKIQASASTTAVQVDRALPNLTGGTSALIQFIIYPQGEVKDAFGLSSPTYYWDAGTLAFDSSCDTSIEDVKVWNMNNIYAENLAGVTGTSTIYEGFTRYGSYNYMGQMNPYFGFDLSGTALTSDSTSFACLGISGIDPAQKVLSVIHYTNNTISNFYGEFFHIDTVNNKLLKLYVPDIMYGRRDNNGGTSTSGLTMGMTFVSSGDSKYVGTSNIEYYDLIEDPTLVTGKTITTVGRVYPQLKVVTLHDEELVAAMSYKSNRNWTLPALSLNLISPNSGTGMLDQNKAIYVTYQLALSGVSGYTTSLPCQKYAKIVNSTNAGRDIQFKLEGTGLLPYMRKTEAVGYDGRGFMADSLRVLYQIVNDSNSRPDPDLWVAANFTSTAITTTVGGTISPTSLELQNPTVNGFLLSTGTTASATLFNLINDLSLPAIVDSTKLNFGDERFFYGNLTTFIGATIYKTIFDVRLNPSYFVATNNPTRSTDLSTNPPDLRVSEIGIYDDKKNLVMIGKISEPVALVPGNTIMLELSMDF